jgi:SnoaL-like domain
MGLCPGNRTRARPADIGRVAAAVPYPAHVTPRDLLGRLYDAFNRRAYDEAMTLLHPDFIEDWPQSGEVIRGPANLRAILENYPGGVDLEAAPAYHGRDEEWAITPGYTVVRVTDNGKTGTAVLKIRYADGSEWWMIVLIEVRDDLLYRQTTFFAEPFEAPEWRAQWVERANR